MDQLESFFECENQVIENVSTFIQMKVINTNK